MGCSWFNTETNKKKTSINNKNMHQISSYETKSPAKNLQISSCSIATLITCMQLQGTILCI